MNGDASADSPVNAVDSAADVASVDAHTDGVVFGTDAHVGDAIDECVPAGGACTSNSDCCDGWCGWHNECDMAVPPYGSPVPQD